MQRQQQSSLPRLEMSITHVLMDTSSRLIFPDVTIWKSRKGRTQPPHGSTAQPAPGAGGTDTAGDPWDRRQCLTLTHQLDVLLTDTQPVGHPAHGSCLQQVVAHPHRQVAGDVLLVRVLVSLGRAGRAGFSAWAAPQTSQPGPSQLSPCH